MSEHTASVLLDAAWNLLQRGQADGKHAFATPVVATVGPGGTPRSRTLVLRRALRDRGQLWCYTDRRSRKATDLATPPHLMSWTFWDKRHRIQVNALGPTHWLPEPEARARFAALPKHSRKSYATLAAPGTPRETPGDGLPQNWPQRDLGETDYAAEYFGVLVTTVTRLEILRLSREGHDRVVAARPDGESGFTLTYLVP